MADDDLVELLLGCERAEFCLLDNGHPGPCDEAPCSCGHPKYVHDMFRGVCCKLEDDELSCSCEAYSRQPGN